ncbi:hypothetical protein G6F32_017241 [Rhizopus arrhizus]|nr:hypothetical protein G6F32_017241 [Rhizopus arrhizus]
MATLRGRCRTGTRAQLRHGVRCGSPGRSERSDPVARRGGGTRRGQRCRAAPGARPAPAGAAGVDLSARGDRHRPGRLDHGAAAVRSAAAGGGAAYPAALSRSSDRAG